MANRFNKYKEVDYVGLPIDAYQFALGSKEMENMAKLTANKSAFDTMRSIEAIANPDVEMKAHIINTINDEIAGLSKKNLKGNDVLLELDRIVNNNDYINKLTDIYGNSQNYHTKQQLDKEHLDEYGNDINTLRSSDEWAAYNAKGMDAFRGGVLSGYTPGKFVDIVGDMQKVLEKKKASGWEQDELSGMWINKEKHEEITTEELLATSGLLLNDPKYQTQLQNISYSQMRKFGDPSDPATAIKNYNSLQATNLNNKISDITKALAEMEEDRKNAKDDKKPGYDKMIEQGRAALKSLSDQRNAYEQDKSGSLFNKDIETSLAMTASAPFSYRKTSNTLDINPVKLAEYKSNLAFGNALRMHNIKRKEKLEDEQKANTDQFLNAPLPTVQSLTIQNADGKDVPVAAIQFDEKGGLSIDAMAETIAGAFTKDGKAFGINLKGVYDLTGITSKINIAAKLRSGEWQGWYIPASKEFVITTPEGTSRTGADLHTQRVMEPLYKLYHNEGNEKTVIVDGVSLDGRNPYRVYSYKSSMADNPLLYTPLIVNGKQVEPIDMSKYDQKQFNQIMGVNVSKDGFNKVAHSGIFYVVDALVPNTTGRMGGQESVRRILTPEQYNDLKSNNGLLKGSRYALYYKQGNTLTELQGVEDGEGGSILAQMQAAYETRPGGGFRNIRNESLYKKAKVGTGNIADDEESELLRVND